MQDNVLQGCEEIRYPQTETGTACSYKCLSSQRMCKFETKFSSAM